MAQYPAVIELSLLDGSNGFRLDGGTNADYAGYSVASAGDVNGDGFADVIVGANYADPSGALSGASYVVFGHAGGFAANLDLANLDGTDGFRLDGGAPGDDSGRSVASAGDVNGDGFADVIVGADQADPTHSNSGASYVVFGHAGGFAASLDLATLDGTNGFRLDGGATRDYSGRSVASAGDVNGDGFADVIVGADQADPHGSNAGSSYVVFGHAGGFAATLDLSTLNGTDGFRIDGVDSYDNSGRSVASAGDVNGDGFADVIIGAQYARPNGDYSGSSYVVFGKASGFDAAIDLSTLDGTDGFRLDGAADYGHSGRSVASAGDVNGDGFADLIIGAPGATPHGPGSGSSYVVFGKAGGFAATVELSTLNGTDGFRIDGVNSDDVSGRSVASAGDVNGDGFADLIVGAYQAGPHGPISGSSYVVFGKAGGFSPTLDLATLDGGNGFRIDGEGAYDDSGWSVASAGDVNGDGLDDLIVGAPNADHAGFRAGSGYIVFGVLPDTAVDRVGTAASQHLVGGDFDDSLTGRGGDDELWGNGGKDILIGNIGADTLHGGDGADRLNGGAGADSMIGGAGDDVYAVDNAGDVVVEATGEGRDTVNTSIDLTLQGGDSIEVLRVSNTTAGLHLTGNEISNSLVGGIGGDTLDGAGGRDVLTGGAGADTFVFSAAADSTNLARDHITDFAQGSDLIDLSAIDADTGQGGDQAFHLASGARFSDTAGELVVRHIGASTVVLGDVDGDGQADFAVVLSGNVALTGADFVL